jgi:hypothetical protein
MARRRAKGREYVSQARLFEDFTGEESFARVIVSPMKSRQGPTNKEEAGPQAGGCGAAD